MSSHGHDDGEEHAEDDDRRGPPTEFDCPGCTAHNPCEPLKEKDEVLCHYCGIAYEVRFHPNGKLRLREV